MGVPARAAVEAPEGGRASDNGAQPRGRWVAQTAYTCLRCAAHGWHAPFGASPPFLPGAKFLARGGAHASDT